MTASFWRSPPFMKINEQIKLTVHFHGKRTSISFPYNFIKRINYYPFSVLSFLPSKTAVSSGDFAYAQRQQQSRGPGLFAKVI